jgi:hypothetical protein
VSPDSFDLFFERAGDFLEDVLVGEYFDFLSKKVILDLEVGISIVVFYHAQVELLKFAFAGFLHINTSTFS